LCRRFEPPLVFPSGDKYIVADGNRRTTCLKLLATPRRAPTVDLQEFFTECRKNWQGAFPDTIECSVESDRDRVDDILFRRQPVCRAVLARVPGPTG
jgi:ParB-like chromosome segregation protein Spo0J